LNREARKDFKRSDVARFSDWRNCQVDFKNSFVYFVVKKILVVQSWIAIDLEKKFMTKTFVFWLMFKFTFELQ